MFLSFCISKLLNHNSKTSYSPPLSILNVKPKNVVDVSHIKIDEEAEDRLKRNTSNIVFTEYKVIVFTNEKFKNKMIRERECKINFRDINHACIVFSNNHSDKAEFHTANEHGTTYLVYLTGKEMGINKSNFARAVELESVISPPSEENFWYKHTEFQFGCVVKENHNLKITRNELLLHAEKWKEFSEEKASQNYPRNCRGYVDSLLEYLNEGRIWDK